MVHRVCCFKDKDGAEFLDTHSQTCLKLEHLHVCDLLRGVVEGDTLSLATAGQKDLHAEIAEGGISGRGFDRGLSGGLYLVKLCECLLSALADGGPLLLLRFREARSRDKQAHGKHHCDRHSTFIHYFLPRTYSFR